MPQCTSYPDLQVWDAIISIIQSDTYLSTVFGGINPKTRQNEITIHKLPLTEEICKKYPSISVWFKAEQQLQSIGQNNSNLARFNTSYNIDVAYQNADLETAIREAFKLAKDIEYTLKLKPNLNHTCGSHYVSNISPADTPILINNLWTFMITLQLEVFSTSNYLI